MERTSSPSGRADTSSGDATQQQTSIESAPGMMPKKANFLGLPSELRLVVYDHVYSSALLEVDEDRWYHPLLNLLCTGEQIYTETKEHFKTKLTQSTRENEATVAKMQERVGAFMEYHRIRGDDIDARLDSPDTDYEDMGNALKDNRRLRKETIKFCEVYKKEEQEAHERGKRLHVLHKLLHEILPRREVRGTKPLLRQANRQSRRLVVKVIKMDLDYMLENEEQR
jgi:hypothetical protein